MSAVDRGVFGDSAYDTKRNKNSAALLLVFQFFLTDQFSELFFNF